MHDSEWFVVEGQLSLDELLEQGWDVAEDGMCAPGVARGQIVPDEDDDE